MRPFKLLSGNVIGNGNYYYRGRLNLFTFDLVTPPGILYFLDYVYDDVFKIKKFKLLKGNNY